MKQIIASKHSKYLFQQDNMSYIEENLIPDEKILYESKLHWVVFLWPIIWLIVAVVIFLTGGHWAIAGGGRDSRHSGIQSD
ncbi:MAG: hypothetical protein M1398_05445 [Deltaproteobacteria bacterium]|nr:hypothetical protein [Deltaproteobacteria bacterium]